MFIVVILLPNRLLLVEKTILCWPLVDYSLRSSQVETQTYLMLLGLKMKVRHQSQQSLDLF